MSGTLERHVRTNKNMVFHSKKQPRCFRMQKRSPSTTQTIRTKSRAKLLSAYRQGAGCCSSRIASVGTGFGS